MQTLNLTAAQRRGEAHGVRGVREGELQREFGWEGGEQRREE